jgi:hypothetical protein
MVVAVFAIAVALSVLGGVSDIVVRRAAADHTRRTMLLLADAVRAYEADYGELPSEGKAPEPAPAGWSERDWQAFHRARALYRQIAASRSAAPIVAELPPDATAAGRGGNLTYVDGCGKYLDYLRPRPPRRQSLLLSAGRDGDFGTREDNIRSDNL